MRKKQKGADLIMTLIREKNDFDQLSLQVVNYDNVHY